MSINLHVEDYCLNCPEFTARVHNNSMITSRGEIIASHDIHCEHRDKCAAILDYLKFEKEKKHE